MANFPAPPVAHTLDRWYVKATRPDFVLRAEAALVLAFTLTAYGHWFPGHWLSFILLLLVPDVALVPYAFSTSWITAAIYNKVHSYVPPLVLGLMAWRLQSALYERLVVIWIAHIAMDRLLGFGLKYVGEFRLTHLQRAASL